MIDFQKTEVFGINPNDWINNEYLDFLETKSLKTGEVREKYIAKYYGMDFIITDSGRMFLHGSLHKYYNFIMDITAPNQYNEIQKRKGFNGDQFNYSNLEYTIQDLENRFEINFSNSRLHNLEFGVNAKHTLITDMILDNLMLHIGKQFSRPLDTTYRQAQHVQYSVKVYDKGLQYGMYDNILRFELKYIKMQELNRLGIFNLNNLSSYGNLQKLGNLLIKRWSEILLYDYTINEAILTEQDAIRLKDYNNMNFWSKTLSNHRDRHKKRYYKIASNYSEGIKDQILELIKSTWQELIKDCVINDYSNIRSNITHLNTSRIINTHYQLTV